VQEVPLKTKLILGLDEWLTVHRSTTLFDLQLDAQNSHSFTYNILIENPLQLRRRPLEDEQGNARNM
jgi:hypothetical protein